MRVQARMNHESDILLEWHVPMIVHQGHDEPLLLMGIYLIPRDDKDI